MAFVLFDQALGLNHNRPAEAFSVANHLVGGADERYELVFLSET